MKQTIQNTGPLWRCCKWQNVQESTQTTGEIWQVHKSFTSLVIYLFGVLHCCQHCTGHITMGSWKGRVLYRKLPTNSKLLPNFPLEAVPGTKPWPQRWKARVLPHCHHGPFHIFRHQWTLGASEIHTPTNKRESSNRFYLT